MLTKDIEIWLSNSEKPFEITLISGEKAKFKPQSRKELLFGKAKYKRGINPPTHWLIKVARAAPCKPYLNTIINKASKITLVIPSMTVI